MLTRNVPQAVFAALVGVCVAAKLPGHVDGGHDHHHDDAGFVDQGSAQVAFEQPRSHEARPVVAILYDDRVAPAGGSYVTNFETEDGVRVSENGQPGSQGQSNVEGSYS